MTTSAPALGPIPVGFMIWMFALALAVVFILAEMENNGKVSITKRVMAFIFSLMAWTTGLSPWDYVTQYANGTVAATTNNPFSSGAGNTGVIIFGIDTGIFVWSMLLILEILVTIMNRKRVEE
jgi:hypothetical protein